MKKQAYKIFVITILLISSCSTLTSTNSIDKNNTYNVFIDDTYVYKGKKDSKIVLVEYFDFKCSVCAKSRAVINNILNKNNSDIKVVYKSYPFISDISLKLTFLFYKASLESKNKALEVFDYIFDHQEDINTVADIKNIEEKLKIKNITLEEESLINKKIESDISEAKKFPIKGVPTFILNNKILLKGYVSEENLLKKINELK